MRYSARLKLGAGRNGELFQHPRRLRRAHHIQQRRDFLLRPGDKVGLVGPNGAGKTTLFKVICGLEKPDDGTVSMDPGTVVGYFSQEVGEMSGRSALEEVMAGAGRVYEVGREMAELEHRMSDARGPGLTDAEMDRYGELQMEFQHRNGYELENRAEAILTGLGIGKDRFHLPVETLLAAAGRCASRWRGSSSWIPTSS